MSLNSAGYDAVILLNERFLNQLSGALFYNGFLRVAKNLDLVEALEPTAAAELDPALRPFLQMTVRLHLVREPSIDFLKSSDADIPFKMRLLMELRAIVTLWDGLELPFGVRLSLVTACRIEPVPDDPSLIDPNSLLVDLLVEKQPAYLEPGSFMLLLNLAKSELEALSFSCQERALQTMDIQLDTAVMTVIRDYLADSSQCYALALPSFGAYLPDLKKIPANRLFGEVAHCQVLGRYGKQDGDSLAIALNLLGHAGGDPNQLKNFARNCSVGLALPEKALQALIRQAWGQYVKIMPVAGHKVFESPEVNEFVQSAGGILNIAERIAVELATLGFVETHTTYYGLKFIVDYVATFPNCPVLEFQAGNTVCLSDCLTTGTLRLTVQLEIETRLEADPTGWLPDFIPDIELSHERRWIDIFQMRLNMDEVGLKKGKATVTFDEATNALALQLTELDLALDLAISLFPACPFLSFPPWIQDRVIDLAEKILVENCPPIAFSPPLHFKLPLIPWPIKVRGRKLGIDENELTATVDAWFGELKQDLPYVPKYIVNTNNREIHCLGCSGLLDTYEEHQKGFHLLSDAINRGFDGCGRCLPELHTRA